MIICHLDIFLEVIPLHTIRMAKFKKTDHSKFSQRYGEAGTLFYSWLECKMVKTHWKTVCQCKKLDIHQSCDPPFIYPGEIKAFVYSKLCMKIFTVAIFLIIKCWKQPKLYKQVNGFFKMVLYLYNRILLSHAQ